MASISPTVPNNGQVVDPDNHSGALPPSHTAQPTSVTEEPQQAATAPGSGPEVETVTVPAPTWKEQVLGYAKKGRGIVLRKPSLKEHGEKILEGQATVADINEQPKKR